MSMCVLFVGVGKYEVLDMARLDFKRKGHRGYSTFLKIKHALTLRNLALLATLR